MQKDAKKKRLKPDKLDHLLNGSYATDDKIDEGLQLDQYLLWWESLQSQERYEQLAKLERKSAPIAGAKRVDNIIEELLKYLQVKRTVSIFKKGTGSGKEDLKKYQEMMYTHQIVNTIEYLLLFFPARGRPRHLMSSFLFCYGPVVGRSFASNLSRKNLEKA